MMVVVMVMVVEGNGQVDWEGGFTQSVRAAV